jgi:hypothetical protein
VGPRGQSRRGAKHGVAAQSFSIAVALYLAFAVLVAYGAVRVLHARSGSGSPAADAVAFSRATPKYLVLFVLDGARPDYLDIANLPNLDALRAEGTQYTNAMSGILEAETPTGHATIATGSRPDHDGILGFDWANTDNDRFSLFNPDKMDEVLQIVQDSGAPTIGGLYKKRFPDARVVALSGHKYYAAAPLGGPNADAIIYYEGDPSGQYVPVAVPGHVPPAGVMTGPGLTMPTTHLKPGQEDDLATRMALSVIAKMQPRMLLMNYPEFDWPLGHVDGGSEDPAMVATDMQGFDRDLGQIEAAYRKAGILDQTLFVVTADHGMMPITHFVPSDLITNAITQAGTTAPDIATNSGDYVWLADPSKAQAVAQNIVNMHDAGIQEAYYLTTVNGKEGYLPADSSLDAGTEAANQYLLSALLNGHEPQVVVMGTEGASFSDPKSGWKADHGGASWESEHIPLVLAGPGIRAGVTSSAPAQLEDIAPTALTAMGVAPTGMQGHVLTDALTQPSQSAQRARRNEVTQITPDVQAMQRAESPSNVAGGS